MGKVSLKMVLKQFLDHFEKLESSFKETSTSIKEMSESGRTTPPPLSMYAKEFLQLKELTESFKSDINCPMIEGHSDVNRKKNRYKDILPYDKSRVILSDYPGVPGSDYINANYVRGSSGNQRAYIASQGPLPNTLVDFWRMIWETDVLVIVMACNEREAGKYKCEPYWPFKSDEKQQYGNITVELVKWRQVCPDFLVRTFRVCADNEERTICQFHYTTWPDHGVPSSVHPILELVRLMRDVQSTESRPILVHCSAGCGRTGTICSIDYVWALLRTGKLREDFSLFEIISDMRRQRIAMVQTVEQYILCYKAVSTLFEQHLKLIDAHTYENIDGDGEPLGIKSYNNKNEEEESNYSDQSISNETKIDLSNDVISIYDKHFASCPDKLERDLNDDKKLEMDHSELCSPNLQSLVSLSGSCDEIKPHEKLVGKATVIRRPSIAKLKAIFDNPPPISNNSDIPKLSEASTSSRSTRLQRSQSIKENIRNLNFNFQLEINPPKVQCRKKSYTLSAAKLTIYKKNLSIGNLTLQDERASSSRNLNKSSVDLSQNSKPSECITSRQVEHSSDSIDNQNFDDSKLNYALHESRINAIRNDLFEFQSCNQKNSNCQSQNEPDSTSKSEQDCFSQPVIQIQSQQSKPVPIYLNQRQRSQSQLQPRPPSLDDSVPNAPPKPPRTFQHVVDDSCIVRTSEGRLIVTVAQPRRQNIETNFVPINVANAQFNVNANNSFYEQLNARKFHLSSPNLSNMSEQLTVMPSHSTQTNSQHALKPRFCDNSNNINSIYSNSFIPKSLARPMMSLDSSKLSTSQAPMPPDSFSQQFNNNLKYIDVLSGHHFQHHQAKPIILQQSYYEPIYSSRQPFIHPPPRQSSLIRAPNFQVISTRPRSISQGNFRPPGRPYESIYSNREICFNVTANAKPFDSITTASSHSLAPIQVQPNKENVYAEISTIKLQNNNASNGKKDSANNSDQNKPKSNGNSVSKSSSLSKIRNVFKVFRSKSANNSKTTNSVTNVSQSDNHTVTTINSNTSKMHNGSAINPLNGQPLSRPPHSHRFQTPTQWTQV